MKIIDNVMPEVMQDQLISICTDEQFPWGFIQDCTFHQDDPLAKQMNKPKYPSFSHVAIMDSQPRTQYASVISSMLLCMSSKSDMNPTQLFRVRFGLYVPEIDGPLHHNMHVDMREPHTVCLYYVNDADGDTFFFDSNREIIERVTPKKGRMVVFDGSTFHASSAPSKNYRITLNMNYVRRN